MGGPGGARGEGGTGRGGGGGGQVTCPSPTRRVPIVKENSPNPDTAAQDWRQMVVVGGFTFMII